MDNSKPYLNNKKSPRSSYWDIVKGLGITAIVVGHCFRPVVPFVYLFHLAIFFFVSGFLFNETKYGDSPFYFFGARLSSVWPRYFTYSAILVLLHNPFVYAGFYPADTIYNHTSTLQNIASNSFFAAQETLAGALWFVLPWLISSTFFCGCVWFGRTLSSRMNRTDLKLPLICLSSCLIGFCGYMLNMRQAGLMFNMHAAFLVVPVYLAAYLLRTYVPSYKRMLTWYGCLLSAIILWWVAYKAGMLIMLDSMTIPGIWFYPITLTGIYFVMSLAFILERMPIISSFFAWLGTFSFEIMALHFTVFKLTDLVYRKIFLPSNTDVSGFPTSFQNQLWPVYIILGLILPPLAGILYNYTIKFLFTQK